MIYDFLAYCFIPAASVWFAGTSGWMSSNFSILRNSGRSSAIFLAWGIILLLCFSLWFRDISRSLSGPRTADRLARGAGLILAAALFTPYLPDQFPRLSRLHFYCAFLSPVLFMAGLLLLLLRFRQVSRCLARRFLLGFWFVVLFSLILLWKGSMVTSALEIFFSSACSILLRRLHKRTAALG